MKYLVSDTKYLVYDTYVDKAHNFGARALVR